MDITGISTGLSYGSEQSGVPSSTKISDLKLRISSNEKKLEELSAEGKAQSAQAKNLDLQIKRYEARLDELENNRNKNSEETDKADKKRRFDSFECQTCKNRRYQDDSDDSGVSFQSATRVAPSAADMAVRSHENEHVVRNRNKAEQNGMKIVSQSVTIQRAICPECGRVYTAGGVTRTKMVTDTSDRYSVGMFDSSTGQNLNTVA